jgi:protein ImuB
MIPFVPPPAKTERPSLSVTTAMRICRPPEAVNVVLAGNAPTLLFWNGLKYVVRELAGPWRVSGQWWSEANWCHEEWDVRLASETVERICRIAFDPRSRNWYVQEDRDGGRKPGRRRSGRVAQGNGRQTVGGHHAGTTVPR